MSNLQQILDRGIDYLTRSFEESSRVIGEAIEKDGAVKITLAITVDGDELTTRFSVGKKATKVEPEKSTLDDEKQLPLPARMDAEEAYSIADAMLAERSKKL